MSVPELSELLSILLFLAAWIGHGYVLMLTLNVIYSRPFHRKFLKALRLVCGLLLVGGPPLFATLVGFDLIALGQRALADGSYLIPTAYAWICVLLGGIAFPAVTVYRLLRGNPKIVRDERTETVDVAKELGGRPVGDGKHRHLARKAFLDLFNVEFTTLTLAVPGLPATWDGLSILHLSDFHFFGTPGRDYFEFVVRRCMADGVPDVLVLSGDFIDDDRYLDWIEPVFGPLRWNAAAFAILGNHDWWQDFDAIRERLAGLNLRVISNRWEAVDVRGERLVAIGHEGPWFRPAPDLAGCPDGFWLLVSHTPDNIGWARQHDCRLMLSGHNHGGQIRVPIFGSLFVPSRYSRRYDAGTFHEPPTILHVTRGLSGKEPLRLLCRPQVSRLVLRPG
ncbi:MAG TPA: metallophosphoesterase [Gemmataceae bacterium]|nr:metallophosphoesterase [Gemmataceae bacterium]